MDDLDKLLRLCMGMGMGMGMGKGHSLTSFRIWYEQDRRGLSRADRDLMEGRGT